MQLHYLKTYLIAAPIALNHGEPEASHTVLHKDPGEVILERIQLALRWLFSSGA